MTDLTDLISRADAMQACQVWPSDVWSRATRSGYSQAATDCAMNILKIPPVALPPAQVADPAQIREAALREAADMLARQGYGTAVRQILAMIPTPPAVSDDVAEIQVALADLVCKRESILIDVRSAHSARGDGAASWMREDDRDFIRDLDLAFDAAEAALAKMKGGA